MSKLWNDLKKNVKGWGAAAVEKAEEVSKIAVAKTEELTKISKIKIEIHQTQRDLNKIYEKLGRLVSSQVKENKQYDFKDNSEFLDQIKKVDEIQASINEKEVVIQNIKEEYDLKESDIQTTSKESEAAEEPVPKEESEAAEEPEPKDESEGKKEK